MFSRLFWRPFFAIRILLLSGQILKGRIVPRATLRKRLKKNWLWLSNSTPMIFVTSLSEDFITFQEVISLTPLRILKEPWGPFKKIIQAKVR